MAGRKFRKLVIQVQILIVALKEIQMHLCIECLYKSGRVALPHGIPLVERKCESCENDRWTYDMNAEKDTNGLSR